MTGDLAFVTFCRRCGEMSELPIDRLPATAAELESLRADVAAKCPDHGKTSKETAQKALSEGNFSLCPPVLAEIREYVTNGRGVGS